MIVTEIEKKVKEQLNGNKEHDFSIIQENIDQHKKDPAKRAIYRILAKLMYEKIENISEEEIYSLFEKQLSECDVTLEHARYEFGKKHYDRSESILLDLIAKEEALNRFENSTMEEYFAFQDPCEQIIYGSLHGVKKKVRLINENYAFMYKLTAVIKSLKKDYASSKAYYEKALKFNPMDEEALMERIELLKLKKEYELYEQATRDILDDLFRPMYIARSYRNLAFCFEEKGDFQTALACLIFSLNFEKTNIDKELRFIEAMSEKKIERLSFQQIHEIFNKNEIILAPSTKITTILYGSAERVKKENPLMATYLLQQLFILTRDPMIDAEIKELRKSGPLRTYTENELKEGMLFDELMNRVKTKDPQGLANIFNYLSKIKLILCTNFTKVEEGQPYKVIPALLKDKNGTLLMPCFTKESEITKNFGDKYQRTVTSLLEIIIMVEKNPSVKGIVVNAFGKSGLVIGSDNFEFIKKLCGKPAVDTKKLN